MYSKVIKTTVYGDLGKQLEEEKKRRGNYRGVTSEIIKEALRKFFDSQ